MADEVWIRRRSDGTWHAEGSRSGQIYDGWEGIAGFVEAGLIVRWDSPEDTQRFTDELGGPEEI